MLSKKNAALGIFTALATLRRDVHLDRLYRFLVALAVAVWALFAVVLYGELVGWWHDAGELALVALSIIGSFVSIAAIFLSATRKDVTTVATAVVEANVKHDASLAKLDATLAKHDATNQRLDATNQRLDAMLAVLLDIRDRLGPRP